MVPPCSPLPPRRLMGEVPQLQGRSATTPALPEGDFRHQVTIAKAPRSRGRACVCKRFVYRGVLSPAHSCLSTMPRFISLVARTARDGRQTRRTATPQQRGRSVCQGACRELQDKKKDKKKITPRGFSKKIRLSCASRALWTETIGTYTAPQLQQAGFGADLACAHSSNTLAPRSRPCCEFSLLAGRKTPLAGDLRDFCSCSPIPLEICTQHAIKPNATIR